MFLGFMEKSKFQRGVSRKTNLQGGLPKKGETPKLESDSEVVNHKRKTKPLLINEVQEDDRFVIDEEYDIVIKKQNIAYLSVRHFLSFSYEKIQSESLKIEI